MTPVVAAIAAAAAVLVTASMRTSDVRRSPRRGRTVVSTLSVPLKRLLDPAAVRIADRRARTAAERTVEADLPDLIDLLVLTTSAGLTVPASLPVLERWGPASLSADLGRVRGDIALGARAAVAVGALGDRWGDPARPLVGALVSHLADGTPLQERLERVAADARARRQRVAETRARRLPVVLLFPLVTCVLPAFGLLTVAPLVAGTFRSLSSEPFEASASIAPPPEVSRCSSESSTYSSPDGDGALSGDSRPPSTRSSSSARLPSPSSSSPGPAGPTRSPACSTPSWTASSAG